MKPIFFLLVMMSATTLLAQAPKTATPKAPVKTATTPAKAATPSAKTAATSKATPAKQASATAKPATNVEIKYDEARQYYYVYDVDNQQTVKVLPYNKVYQFREGMAKIESEKGVGFINQAGKEVIAPNGKYKWVGDFSNGLAYVCTVNEEGMPVSAGYINKTGALAIPMQFQHAFSFSEGLAPVKKNGKWGYINKAGTLVIPAIYEDAKQFAYGLAAVSKMVTIEGEKSPRYGYIDKTGKQVLPFTYIDAGEFRNTGLDVYNAIVISDVFPCTIDKKGNMETSFWDMPEKMFITNLEWAEDDGDLLMVELSTGYSTRYYGLYSNFATIFIVNPANSYSPPQPVRDPLSEQQFYMVKSYGKLGLVKSNSAKLEPVYDHIQFVDRLVYAFSDVKMENQQMVSAKISLFDLNLKPLTTFDYESVRGFIEELACVKREGKVGFINRKGEEVIKPSYDDAGNFSNGHVSVLKDQKVGVINKSGEVVIPFDYEDIGAFSDGVTFYKKSGMYGLMDTTGKKITEPTFEGLGNVSEGLLAFLKDKKIGFINTKGEVVIQPQFDFANPFSEGLAMVAVGNKAGFIDKQGNTVIPCTYDNAESFRDGCALVVVNGAHSLIDKKGSVIKTYAAN